MKNAKISVIMPSYLGEYPRCAKNRDIKLKRAIESILNQTYQNFELIVIADGCDLTVKIVSEYYRNLLDKSKIQGFKIDKQRLWSGAIRNVGLDNAKGDIICYLDSDDMFEFDHLQFIAENFKKDWSYFDERIFKNGNWHVNKCNINHFGVCGTSNIAHIKTNIVRWAKVARYATDDWGFIKDLSRNLGAGNYIGNGKYKVCHIPNQYDI